MNTEAGFLNLAFLHNDGIAGIIHKTNGIISFQLTKILQKGKL